MGASLKRLADICRDSYKHTPEIENKRYGVEVYIIRENGDTVVCFRGTHGAKDIFTDMRSMRWYDRFTKCWYHKGFLKSTRSVWDDILNEIKDDNSIILVGHSLGAAQATITAAFMVQSGIDFKALVTFGSPRVGFGGLKKKLQGNLLARYCNGNDIVTQVPWSKLGWVHVSIKKKIGDVADCIDDHKMENYIKEIEKLLPVYF